MNPETYKISKEAFVSGMNGSTVTHINLVSSVALASILFFYVCRGRIPSASWSSLPVAWTLLVLPLLLSMTLFATRPGTLALLLGVPAVLLINVLPRKEYGTPLPSNLASPVTPSTPSFAPALPSKPTALPSLTTYRAHMMIMTVLGILAVDFPVFPRSLAKCETYGVSLMDLGVGSFVFSQGVVSAIPLIKNPSHLVAPLAPKVLKALRKSLPIILLGIIRVLLVKGTEYPEHESEYGTHWNFFITLALLPLMEVVLHPMMIRLSVTAIGVAVAILQQVLLSKFGFADYVLHAPRIDLISANKEGIVSLTGYFAVHLLGLTTGTLILPPSPSYFRRIQRVLRKQPNGSPQSVVKDAELDKRYTHRQDDKTATELCAYSALWWAIYGLIRLMKLDGGHGVSRRMVNLSYILWICAFNVSFILGYLLLDIIFFPSPSSAASKKASVSEHPLPSPLFTQEISPPLLEAINRNGLMLFLFANISTGLINLTIPTIYTSDFWAMVILCGYSYGISAVAWHFRHRRLGLWIL